jgi:hypothetical protein
MSYFNLDKQDDQEQETRQQMIDSMEAEQKNAVAQEAQLESLRQNQDKLLKEQDDLVQERSNLLETQEQLVEEGQKLELEHQGLEAQRLQEQQDLESRKEQLNEINAQTESLEEELNSELEQQPQLTQQNNTLRNWGIGGVLVATVIGVITMLTAPGRALAKATKALKTVNDNKAQLELVSGIGGTAVRDDTAFDAYMASYGSGGGEEWTKNAMEAITGNDELSKAMEKDSTLNALHDRIKNGGFDKFDHSDITTPEVEAMRDFVAKETTDLHGQFARATADFHEASGATGVVEEEFENIVASKPDTFTTFMENKYTSFPGQDADPSYYKMPQSISTYMSGKHAEIEAVASLDNFDQGNIVYASVGPTSNPPMSSLSSSFEDATQGIGNFFSGVREAVAGVTGKAVEATQQFTEQVAELAGNSFEAVKEVAGDTVNTVMEHAHVIGPGILAVEAGVAAYQAAKDKESTKNFAQKFSDKFLNTKNGLRVVRLGAASFAAAGVACAAPVAMGAGVLGVANFATNFVKTQSGKRADRLQEKANSALEKGDYKKAENLFKAEQANREAAKRMVSLQETTTKAVRDASQHVTNKAQGWLAAATKKTEEAVVSINEGWQKLTKGIFMQRELQTQQL